MLLVSMVAVIVLLLILLSLLQVVSSTLQQGLHMLHEVTSTCVAASLHQQVQW